jgi:hypothetical protein
MTTVRNLLDHANDRASFDNEEGDLLRVEYNNRRIPQEPTLAICDCAGVPVSVGLYAEDRHAFKSAGYTITDDKFSPRNPTVRLEFIDSDLRIRQIQHADMQSWKAIRRANEPRAEVVSVSSAAPVDEPDSKVVDGLFPGRDRLSRSHDEQPPNGTNLYMKKARIMGMLETIPKNGYNEFQRYYYTTAGDMYDAVRKAMAAQSLALQVRYVTHRMVDQTFIDNYGKSKSQTMTYIDLEFVLCCGDTGATETTPWIAQTTTTHDKSIAGAITNAEKAFLQSTFIISTGEQQEDTDSNDQSDTVSRTDKPAAPKRQASKSAAPPVAPAQIDEPMFTETMLAHKVKYISAGNSSYVLFDSHQPSRLYGRDKLRELGEIWAVFADGLKAGGVNQEAIPLPAPVYVTAESKTNQSTKATYWQVTSVKVAEGEATS